MSAIFKRKPTTKASTTASVGPATSVRVSDDEAALATSEFNTNKITDIQNRFHGGAELLIPGRIFIREGTLVKMCRKGPKPRQFFLFNDILVYGIILPTKGRYAQQHILPLEQMSVTSDCHFMPSVYTAHTTELDEHVDTENAFQINHKDKSFHVFASSSSDKSNWIHNLRKHIAKQSKGKEDASFAVRAVWVPDDRVALCMVCRTKFSTFNRKHHCRNCGKVVCGNCSSHRLDIDAVKSSHHHQEPKLERVCDECFKLLQGSAPDKPTVIDFRSSTSPKDRLTVEATNAQTDPAGNGLSPKKREKPSRPPPPSSVADRKPVARNETFVKPPVQSPSESRAESDTSSDSEDSAIIDLTNVDPADPFTMQRAESSSPLLGSEPLADVCDRVQKRIRASILAYEEDDTAKPENGQSEEAATAEHTAADEEQESQEEKKDVKSEENGGLVKAPHQKVLGPKVLPDLGEALAKTRRGTDGVDSGKPAEAPVAMERKKKSVRTLEREERLSSNENGSGASVDEEKVHGDEVKEGLTTESSKDVDALLSMTAEEQPSSATSPLVTLATDPPALSTEPLIPVSVQPTPKKRTDRRKKQFKSSSAKPTPSSTAELPPMTVTDSAQAMEELDLSSSQDQTTVTETDAAEETQQPEDAADVSEKTEQAQEPVEVADLVDVSEPQAAADLVDVSEALAAATTEQTPPDHTPSETVKTTSRADRRKNRFKKKTAD